MSANIESILVENRVFKPSAAFAKAARVPSFKAYREQYEASIRNPAKFWEAEARELIWQKRWTRVLEWKSPFAKWFIGGKLNVSENCLDRHAATRNAKTKRRSSSKANRATRAR